MRTNFQIKSRNLSYTKQGDGFVVVFLHGFCEDLTMWDAFNPFTNNDICKLSIDLPGFGQSSIDDSLSMESMADDVKAVLDREGIETCVLIGHSMGGYVGLAFAEKYPEYLKGFGLFHSHPYADGPDTIVTRKKSIEFIEKHGSELLISQLIPKLFEEKFLAANQSLVEGLVKHASGFPAEGIRMASIAMLNRADRTAVLEAMDCPILFIIGDKDYAIPTETSLNMSYLPAVASIEVLRDCGHMGMYERKPETEKMVHEFVQFCL